MDAQTKEYLGGLRDQIMRTLSSWLDRLDPPTARRDVDADTMDSELGDRVVGLDDRFRTTKLRIQQLEARVSGEKVLVHEDRRLIRELNVRLREVERRLDAQARIIARSPASRPRARI